MKIGLSKLMLLFALLAPAAVQAQGGGMGSGGGNFTVALFWQRVEQEIIPALKLVKERTPPYLSQLQISSLIYLMNPRVTKVTLSRKPLHWKDKDGVKTAVDALNYPARRQIKLHLDPWQQRVNQGFDVNHLILHEFMGLARIDDTGGLSSKILPPVRRPIDFDVSVVKCQTMPKYVRLREGNWEVRDMPEHEVRVTLSAPRALNPAPRCATADASGACLQPIGDIRMREGQVRIPVVFDEGDAPEGSYHVEAQLQLVSGYNNYGWGAAASRVFRQNPELHIVWKLVHTDASGKARVLSLLHNSTNQTNEYSSKVTLHQAIPVPAFVELLEKNGFKLSLFPYNGEMSAPFHSMNIGGFMAHQAREAGQGGSIEQMDAFLTKRLFAGAAGNAIPFRVHAQCDLEPDPQ